MQIKINWTENCLENKQKAENFYCKIKDPHDKNTHYKSLNN